MDRRAFLQAAAVPLVLRHGQDERTKRHSSRILSPSKDERPAPQSRVQSRKAVLISMLPKDGTYAQRSAIAHEAGFDAIEMQTVARDDEAAEIRDAATTAGLHIHSVMNADHWRFPLSSADRETVTKSVAGMQTSLRNAKLWGAD